MVRREIPVSEWKNPIIGQNKVVCEEIYPKRTIDALKHNLMHPLVRRAYTKFYDSGLTPKELDARISTQKALLSKIIKKCEPWEASDKFYSVKVAYRQQGPSGRLGAVGKMGSGDIARVLRWTLNAGVLQDIDICNAHPNFLLHMIEKMGMAPENESLRFYVKNREKVLAKVMEQRGVDRAGAKQLLLAVMNGGKKHLFDEKKEGDFLNFYIAGMNETLKSVYDHIISHPELKEKYVRAEDKADDWNLIGSTVNRMFCDLENQCLCVITKWLSSWGYTVGVLSFDGCMVRRKFDPLTGNFSPEDPVSEKELRLLEEKLLEEVGIPLRLETKPFAEGVDISALQKNKGRKEVPEDQDLIEDFIEHFGDQVRIFDSRDFWLFDSRLRIWRQGGRGIEIGHLICERLSALYRESGILAKAEIYEATMKSLKTLKCRRDLGEFLVSNPRYWTPGNSGDFFNRQDELLPLGEDKVVNLRTLEISERGSEHYFTFSCQHLPSKDFVVSEKVNRFFSSLFLYPTEDGMKLDEEMFTSFRRTLGLSLTGKTQKKIFFILGEKDTGKSTLFRVLERAIGDTNIINVVSKKLLLEDRSTSHISTEHTQLHHGLRIGYRPELLPSDSLKGDRIKRLTGGDRMVYRPLHSNEKSYETKTKLFIFSNYMPRVSSEDCALTERILAYQFRHRFADTLENREFVKSVKEDKASVISFLLLCAREYFASGEQLLETELMQSFKKEEVSSNDGFENFDKLFKLREGITCEADLKKLPVVEQNEICLTHTELRSMFEDYMMDQGYSKIMTPRKFQMQLALKLPVKTKVDRMIRGKRARGYIYPYVCSQSFGLDH